MRTDLKIEAALWKVAAVELHEGHEKEALAAAGKALKFVPSLLRSGKALVTGAPKVMNAAGQMAPAVSRFGAARQAYQAGMQPGVIRTAIGRAMHTPGATNAWSNAGKSLMRWGVGSRAAGRAATQAGNAAWDAASGWGKAKMIGGKLFNASPWLYTAGSLMNSHNQGQALNEEYARGAGEALGYMRANPMKTLGFMLTNPDYASNFIKGQPAFQGAGAQWVGGNMGNVAADTFRNSYQAYNANPALIGDRIRQRVESNYEKPFAFGLPWIGN